MFHYVYIALGGENRIDPHTGVLTPLEVYPVGKNPMWVLPVRLAAA